MVGFHEDRGVTLVELLIVMIIVAILSVVIVISMQDTIEEAGARTAAVREAGNRWAGNIMSTYTAPLETDPTRAATTTTLGTVTTNADDDYFCRGQDDADCTTPEGETICTLTVGDGLCRDPDGEVLCGISPATHPDCIPGLVPEQPGSGGP